MLLSAALMLDWLGQQHDESACAEAAVRLERAVEDGYRSGAIRPIEQGGEQTTTDVARAVTDGL
jgi:3-isopropylmalate dehydrogenase